MSETIEKAHRRTRLIISTIAAVLVGLTLAMAGSGKLGGFGEMPGQTIMILDRIIPEAWLTPEVSLFIGEVFLPYIIPGIELILGILLILSIWPRIMAILCLPLTMAFMASNYWLIRLGVAEFSSCECFGIWEVMFGSLKPIQSMYIDIGLFVLALIIIFLHPGGFLYSPPWAVKLEKKRQAAKNRRASNNGE